MRGSRFTGLGFMTRVPWESGRVPPKLSAPERQVDLGEALHGDDEGPGSSAGCFSAQHRAGASLPPRHPVSYQVFVSHPAAHTCSTEHSWTQMWARSRGREARALSPAAWAPDPTAGAPAPTIPPRVILAIQLPGPCSEEAAEALAPRLCCSDQPVKEERPATARGDLP